MDTPVKIIVATMVLMIVAAIILSMFSSQTGPLSDFITNEREGAQCDVGLARYKSACDCSLKGESNIPETEEASQIKEKYDGSCGWATGAGSYACHQSCPDWNPYS